MKLLSLLVVVLLVATICAIPWPWTKKYVRIDGTFTCNGKPLKNVAPLKVTAFDKDDFTSDDKIDSTSSDKNGLFTLKGGRFEMTGLKVYLKVDDLADQCARALPKWLRKIEIRKHGYSGTCNGNSNYKYYKIEVDLKYGNVLYINDAKCPK